MRTEYYTWGIVQLVVLAIGYLFTENALSLEPLVLKVTALLLLGIAATLYSVAALVAFLDIWVESQQKKEKEKYTTK